MADVTSPFGFPYPEDTDLVRDGASDIENLATGVNDYLTGGYLYAGTRYYTSSGTFAKADPLGTGDIGLRAIRIRLVAGGGGGGGSTTVDGGGGGGAGGGYAERFYTDIAALDTSVTVTRGSGGAGGVGDSNGVAGGVSEFGGVGDAWRTRAEGGIEGRRASTSGGGPNGPATDGDLLIPGSGGGAGGISGSGRGHGGNSHLGGGGGATLILFNQDGQPGGNYGGGGAGARVVTSPASHDGGAGANGIVIVDVFV